MIGCKKCGLCCKYVGMIISWPCSESDLRWMEYHGYIINPLSEGTEAMLFAPCRCTMLGEDNLCTIYDTRPDNCRMMPVPGQEQFQPPGCGFFKPVVDSTTQTKLELGGQ